MILQAFHVMKHWKTFAEYFVRHFTEIYSVGASALNNHCIYFIAIIIQYFYHVPCHLVYLSCK